jgi:hypothetical protein
MQMPSQFREVPEIAQRGKLGGEKSRVGILTSDIQPNPHISHWHQHRFAGVFWNNANIRQCTRSLLAGGQVFSDSSRLRHCKCQESCIGNARDSCRKRAKAVRPLTFAFFARSIVAVLGGVRVVNLVVDCCRFSDAGKGKLGTILAHSWHNFGTNDFDILQPVDFKYVYLWCREGGVEPPRGCPRRILSPPGTPVSIVLSMR